MARMGMMDQINAARAYVNTLPEADRTAILKGGGAAILKAYNDRPEAKAKALAAKPGERFVPETFFLVVGESVVVERVTIQKWQSGKKGAAKDDHPNVLAYRAALTDLVIRAADAGASIYRVSLLAGDGSESTESTESGVSGETVLPDLTGEVSEDTSEG